MPGLSFPKTIFRSLDTLVRQIDGFSQDVCVVTFDSFSDRLTLERSGFAELFLRTRGIDAIHVIARHNEWYQHPDIPSAMAAIRASTSGYARVLTYGSSMGAYAAIRLAGWVGACAALAMSPQFSILPHRVPFEHRWNAQAVRQRDVWETALALPNLPEAYILYDPLNLDAVHAERLSLAMPTIPVRLRGAGHHVAAFLQDIGLLERVVLDACRGPLDVAALEQQAWNLRRRSPQARLALAARARGSARRIAFIRSAAALAPDQAPVLSQLALELDQAGRVPEALDNHRAAIAIEPGQPTLLIRHAVTLAGASDVAGALATVAELSQAMDPQAFAALQARLTAALDPPPRRTVPVNPGPYPAPDAVPVRTVAGQVGYVVFGPFTELRPGRYLVTFFVRPGPGPVRRLFDHRVACRLDVAIHGGRTVLARRRMSTAALRNNGGSVTLAFEMPSWTACEFRVRATGAAGLIVGLHRPVRRA